MSSAPEPVVGTAQTSPVPQPDRRADIEAKQIRISALLTEVECDALIVLEPENFAWLSSGGNVAKAVDPSETPGLYFSHEVRALMASTVDCQRLFDEEIDGLGFQLKEWSWGQGREPLINYLTRGRRIACDRPMGDCKVVGEHLRKLRRTLSPYELAGYKHLGRTLAHALEATCRTMTPKETEQEIAGHLSHRLLKHGAEVLSMEIAGDDRSRRYRRATFSPAPVLRYCVLSATARLGGLCATASRTVSFGPPDATLQKEHDAACKISATYVGGSMPDAVPGGIVAAARRVYLISGYEHEWRLCPPGFLTGRAAVEQMITPYSSEPLPANSALTWKVSIGSACCCDTIVVVPSGPIDITPASHWPLKKIRIQSSNFFRPDVLQK